MKYTSEATVTPIFQANNIRAGYGDVVVVDGVSIHVSQSEIVAIVGPNGSGKSTLLKSFFGFARFFGGTLAYEGKDITGLSADRMIAAGIGYIPQSANVFANLTITENLEMGAYTRRDGSQIGADIQNIFEIFHELKHRAHSYAGTLSGGERQMLAIARAMMAQPKVLLLDEPLASLSPKSVDGIVAKLKLISRSGTALILIEQNVMKALSFAQRGYILVEGRSTMEGPAATLLNDEHAKRRYLGLE
jgi:ABC-type branched-subunit amino acid transport system ATPase component